MSVFTINEKTEPTHEYTILDEDGNASQPTVFTLTYYNRATGAIINSRDGQNVLNLNNVVITNGVMAWSMQVADTTIVDNASVAELNVALWQWTDAGGKDGSHETIIRVLNFAKVT